MSSFATQIQHPQKFIGQPLTQAEDQFIIRQAILYALGIGFSQDPLKQEDLKYTYELRPDFTIFPIFGTCFRKKNIVTLVQQNKNLPRFNQDMMLHAQQRIQLIEPVLKPNTKYITKSKIIDIVEKEKMTLIYCRFQTFQKCNNDQLKICLISQSAMAIRNLKAKGYKGNNLMTLIPKIPKREQDLIIQSGSFPNQAILYRLSGDLNPHNIDPKVATKQNFERPILHGLATKGIIARTIVQKLLNNEPSKLKSFHSRFLGHVYPGQSFQIKLWKEQTYTIFEVTCKQRGTKVLMGSFQLRQNAKF